MATQTTPRPQHQPEPVSQDSTQDLPALTGDDFIDHIMVEHSQFITLLEQVSARLSSFLDGETTLGAVRRLRDEINKALPAAMSTQLIGGGK